MEKLVILFVCLLMGMGLRGLRVFPDNAPLVINRFLIYVSLPAIVIQHVHEIDFGAMPLAQLLGPASMPWLHFLGAWALAHGIGKKLHWHPHTIGALALTAGLGNTSFVGFPLIEALYGAEGLASAILVDQLGSFFVMSTLGIGIAIAYSGGQLSKTLMAKKLVTFPPFLALCFALLTQPIPMPAVLSELLDVLSATLVPLALTAVGMQLRINRQELADYKAQLAIGLGYKLFFASLFFYFVYGLFMDMEAIPFKVVVLEAAMAPMVTSGIIATEYKLRGDLAALMIGIGIPISLVSVPILNSVLW